MTSPSGSSDEDSPLRRLTEWLGSPAQPETGSTRLRVAPDPAGSWVITEPGRDDALQRLGTRDHAVALATATLSEARGGELEVCEEDGTTTRLPVAKGRRPWWQATRTPRAALLLGLLWLGLTVIRVVDEGWRDLGVVHGVLLVVSGVLAGCYLTSAALLRRRRRSQRI